MKDTVCKRCGKPLKSGNWPKGYCNTICYDSHMMILDAEQYEDDRLIEEMDEGSFHNDPGVVNWSPSV